MTQYLIKLHGHLDERWKTMFPGFNFTYEITHTDQPITIMTGKVIDQSALYGIINRLQNMNVELISFQPQKQDQDH